jgi:hypothetical protein
MELWLLMGALAIPWMIYDWTWSSGRMIVAETTKVLSKKPVPILCSPENPHGLPWKWTQASVVMPITNCLSCGMATIFYLFMTAEYNAILTVVKALWGALTRWGVHNGPSSRFEWLGQLKFPPPPLPDQGNTILPTKLSYKDSLHQEKEINISLYRWNSYIQLCDCNMSIRRINELQSRHQ